MNVQNTIPMIQPDIASSALTSGTLTRYKHFKYMLRNGRTMCLRLTHIFCLFVGNNIIIPFQILAYYAWHFLCHIYSIDFY